MKIPRNQICLCGQNKKWKKCCGHPKEIDKPIYWVPRWEETQAYHDKCESDRLKAYSEFRKNNPESNLPNPFHRRESNMSALMAVMAMSGLSVQEFRRY